MDLNKVLFLLLSIVASKVDQVETRPLDFVCDSEVRRVLNKVKDLQQDMVDCGTEDFLPTSIRLPCIKVHKATWGRKSVLERKAEILQSLGLLAQDVRRARTQSQPGCGLLLLERLEHSINNYLHVVTQLHSEGELEGPQTLACLGQDSQDLGLVLGQFGRLLSGKLEWLITDMAQGC
ncbi:thrombopoietin isoform X3 [Brachyhypopomus gauderio]|uniref:thrombopoietin isoform X3 n=1 Tax=Brachyhypopomus gauderio TaxID=698409 RepID=UPI004040FB60